VPKVIVENATMASQINKSGILNREQGKEIFEVDLERCPKF
jgi:hypothetical protein